LTAGFSDVARCCTRQANDRAGWGVVRHSEAEGADCSSVVIEKTRDMALGNEHVSGLNELLSKRTY
jgi:hypothetical protein